MKNPFNILYYTGLTILISLSLIVGLFVINLQNIVKLLPNKKETTVEFVPKADSYVLENLKPIKQEIPKVIKQEIAKPKEQDIIKQIPPMSSPTKASEDSTQIVKDSSSTHGEL